MRHIAWLLVGALTVSCAAGPPVKTPGSTAADSADAEEKERDPDALPKPLEDLSLTADQRAQLVQLIADVRTALQPATNKADEFGQALLSAARSCSADDARLYLEAGRFVRAGEDVRPSLLDAINRFHKILTPKQRKQLVRPLIDGEDPVDPASVLPKDSDDGREDGLAKLAEGLDLSFGQKLRMVSRALDRISVSTQTTNELRAQAINVAAAFRKDQFDIRTHPLAKAPLVKLYTRFVLDLSQAIVPVLTREQCDIAAEFLFDQLEKRRKRKEAKQKKAEAAKKKEGTPSSTEETPTPPSDTDPN